MAKEEFEFRLLEENKILDRSMHYSVLYGSFLFVFCTCACVCAFACVCINVPGVPRCTCTSLPAGARLRENVASCVNNFAKYLDKALVCIFASRMPFDLASNDGVSSLLSHFSTVIFCICTAAFCYCAYAGVGSLQLLWSQFCTSAWTAVVPGV